MTRLLLVALLALLLAPAALAQTGVPPEAVYPWPADTRYAKLNDVASLVARRHVEIACPTAKAWSEDFNAAFYGALGYTYVEDGQDSVARVDPDLCAAVVSALSHDSSYSEPNAGLGLLVVIHESLHMRWWKYRAQESRVECAAIRSLPAVAAAVGVDPVTVGRLMGWAVAFHFWQSFNIDRYAYKPCRVPLPWAWAQGAAFASYRTDGWSWAGPDPETYWGS